MTRMREAIVLAMLFGFALAADAANLTVVVHDERGGAVRGAPVLVRGPQDPPWRGERAKTDAQGIVVFPRLGVGQHEVSFGPLPDPLLVKPRHDPAAPPLSVTVTEPDQRLRLDVELRYGLPVVLQVSKRRGDVDLAMITVRELDTGRRVRVRTEVGAAKEVVLLPGRWEAELETPPGYLLDDIELDGASMPGDRVRLDLAEYDPARFVTWYIDSPSLIRGTVFFSSTSFPVRVGAELIEPGAWFDAARARGGSGFDGLSGAVDPTTGRYSIELPDGVWRLTPIGEIEAADPENALIAVADGEEARADFEVDGGSEREGAARFFVRAPFSQYDAVPFVAELWPADPALRREGPQDRQIGEHTAAVFFPNVPPGDWIVAATGPGYLEGRTLVRDVSDDEEEPRQVEVELPTGAALHAVATDSDQRPVPQVVVQLERLDEEIGALIRDPEKLAEWSAPRAVSDATGHAWVDGIWPGRYRIAAELQGPRRGSHWVRFVDGDGHRDEIELELSDAVPSRQLDLVVVRAARLAGQLACAGDETMPGIVDIAAVRSMALDRDSEGVLLLDEENWEEAWLGWRGRRPLAGDRRDAFVAGPLSKDSLLLAVRPNGFDRWTWAPDGEHPAEAGVLTVQAERELDLGRLTIDCGPAIELLPFSQDGTPLPDLRDVAETVALSGTITRDRAIYDVRRAAVDAWPGRLVLRKLPVGEADLEIGLSSPYFLPVPNLTVVLEQEPLASGELVTLTPPVPGIGGALWVNAGDSVPAIRLFVDGRPRVASVDEGIATLSNLPADLYAVELCATADCVEIASVEQVEITRLETTYHFPE